MVLLSIARYDDQLCTCFAEIMKKIASKRSFLWRYSTYIGVLLCCGALIIALLFLYRQPATITYPIQGFDVSHHQGQIDWKKISPQQYQFVYLKATEGGDYQDDQFQQYWLHAHERGLRIGAYHFYRLCRDGAIQAQNFI